MDKQKIVKSVLSIIVAGVGSFFFLLGTAAMGSGLSNAKDDSNLEYLIGEVLFIASGAMVLIIPLATLVGLFLYWRRGTENKITNYLMFSGGYAIVLYFVVTTLGGLLYLLVRQ